jgi:HEPN domain-containing protein
MSDWPSKIRAELETGKRAQEEGNEGMARVCARRAAGWAASAFLAEKGVELPVKSGYERLLFLMASDLVSHESGERLEALTRSLEKDEPEGKSSWPLDVNLLEEAEQLIEALLPDFLA